MSGHDTTSSGLMWTMILMAQHPDYQIRCQEEIDELLEGRDSDDITWYYHTVTFVSLKEVKKEKTNKQKQKKEIKGRVS